MKFPILNLRSCSWKEHTDIAREMGRRLTTTIHQSSSLNMADVAHCWGFLLLVAIILTFTCKTVGEDDLDDLAFQAGNQQNVQFGPAKKMRWV